MIDDTDPSTTRLEAGALTRCEPREQPLHREQLVAERYRLRTEIGRGGFARVWRAWDQNLEREVAVKFLLPTSGQAPDLARFRAEALALARVHSAGVAQVLDVGIHDQTAFLVLEFVAGRPLGQVLQELQARTPACRAPTIEALRIAIRHPCPAGAVDMLAAGDWYRVCAHILVAVLRSVEAMHSFGIRHRDIKPANVMLRGCGQPVLVDFGLAALTDGPAPPREGLSGSVPYLAPEQLQDGRTGTDHRTDVYQVGLLLYEFLTLRPAFLLDEDPDILAAIRGGRYPQPRALRPAAPRDLEDICVEALANRPEDRYQTAESFRRDLERWLGGRQPPRALRGGSWLRILRSLPYRLRLPGRPWRPDPEGR